MSLISKYFFLKQLYNFRNTLIIYRYFLFVNTSFISRTPIFINNSILDRSSKLFETESQIFDINPKLWILFNYYVHFITLYFCFFEKHLFFKAGFSYLPKKYKTFTVLRSPHTDKKSREQFHLIQYKSVSKCPIFFSLNNCFFYKYFFMDHGFNLKHDFVNYKF